MPRAKVHPQAEDNTSERADQLIADHRHLLAAQEPVLQVPISHLKGGGACKVCKLFYDNPDTFRLVSALLVRGERLADIATVTEKLGQPITIACLSRHRKEHIDPALWSIAGETVEYRAIAQQFLSMPSADVSTLMLMLPVGKVIKAAKRLKQTDLDTMAKSDPAKFLAFLQNYAKALASVQASERQAQLNAAKLKLESMRLDNQVESSIQRGLDAMRKELDKSPEGRRAYEAVAAVINAPKP